VNMAEILSVHTQIWNTEPSFQEEKWEEKNNGGNKPNQGTIHEYMEMSRWHLRRLGVGEVAAQSHQPWNPIWLQSTSSTLTWLTPQTRAGVARESKGSF
jgi:hypothetical protein